MKLLLSHLLVAGAAAAPLAASVTIGPAKIELEETTFAAVAKQLGEVRLAHTGDAGGSRVQACYVTAGHAPTTYYLESGEMGGGDRIMHLDVVGAGSTTAAEDTVIATRCTTLASRVRSARTNSGIMLGLSRAQVERRLQMRGRDSAGVTLYDKSEAHGRGPSAYDVSSWVRVRYLKGRVRAFSVGMVSSS
jgi:hypothetical protein